MFPQLKRRAHHLFMILVVIFRAIIGMITHNDFGIFTRYALQKRARWTVIREYEYTRGLRVIIRYNHGQDEITLPDHTWFHYSPDTSRAWPVDAYRLRETMDPTIVSDALRYEASISDDDTDELIPF